MVKAEDYSLPRIRMPVSDEQAALSVNQLIGIVLIDWPMHELTPVLTRSYEDTQVDLYQDLSLTKDAYHLAPDDQQNESLSNEEQIPVVCQKRKMWSSNCPLPYLNFCITSH